MLVIAVSHGILSDGFTKNAKTEKKLSGWSEALEFVCKTHELQEDQVDEILLVGNDLSVKKLSVEDAWSFTANNINDRLVAAANKAESEFDELMKEEDTSVDSKPSLTVPSDMPSDVGAYLFGPDFDEEEDD
jgi:hypothetical protein